MNIFTGMEAMFFFLGSFSTLFVVGLIIVAKKVQFNWQTWALAISGGLLALFTTGWSVSSFIENEPQAGVAGLVIFGIPAVVFFVLTNRFARKASI